MGSAGNDRYVGGRGVDIAGFTAATEPLEVSLAEGRATGEGGDRLKQIEAVVGGTANDRVIGSAGKNTLAGGPGDDFLDGRAGEDSLNGNDGTDTCRNGERLVSCES